MGSAIRRVALVTLAGARALAGIGVTAGLQSPFR